MLITLIAFVALLLPLASRVVPTQVLWIAPALLMGSLATLIVLMSTDRFLQHLPLRLVRALAGLSADARRVYLSRFAWRVIFFCVLTSLNLSLAAWWVGLSLALPLRFIDYLVFIPAVTLVTLVPVSLGGWGVREGALVALFGLVGVPNHSALAFSVLFGLAGMLGSLPPVIFLWYGPSPPKPAHHPADLLKLAADATIPAVERERVGWGRQRIERDGC